jgi:SOS response regulatory protein OraA/RecX
MADELLNDFNKALAAVTWYLGKRDHSEKELRDKMKRRHTPEVIDQAIAEAKRRKWLKPPAELAEILTRQLAQKRRSHRYIAGYLRKHGLPVTEKDAETEEDKCRRLLETKFRKTANFSFEEKTKAYRFLRYRGFDDATIRRVIYEKS